MKKLFVVALLLQGTLIPVFGAPANQVTQNGITWTFSQPREVGQFVNGDYWVLGPVTITLIDPPPAPGRNGTWTNPGFNVNGNHQPFDNRATYLIYDASLNQNFPATFNTPASLLSTISHDIPLNCAFGNGAFQGHEGQIGNPYNTSCARSWIKEAAVLTVLMSIPPANSFRPPMNGTNKTIQFNESQLDYSKLGQLTPTASNPSLIGLAQRLRGPFPEVNHWANEEASASERGNGYGFTVATDLSNAQLALQLNYTNAQKRMLVIHVVQRGIDLKGALDIGAKWPGNGGHGHGRGYAVKFAGDILNNAEMANILMTSPRVTFGDTNQIFSVKSYPAGTPATTIGNCLNGGLNCGFGSYAITDTGLPEFGQNHWENPSGDSVGWTTNAYRRCCTAAGWVGSVLTQYIMGTAQAVPEDMRAYQDRYMQTETVVRAGHPFQSEMWDAYRSNYARIWNPNDLCIEGTSRPAPLQAGVCAGAQEVCRLKNWWGGTTALYTAHNAAYQQTESACDGLDNDCDGLTDEGCSGGNMTPQVNAGPDRTIVLPAGVTLNGTAVDDGLPNPPGGLTRLWTKISGPGTVVFANAASAATTATISQAGVYVLRLSASDGTLSAFDEVTVNVNAAGMANEAPVVSAGPDVAHTLPGELSLSGSVEDDGLPNPPGTTTITWTKVSGPGNVSFSPANNPETNVTFSQAGAYVLRLSANDSLFSASDEIRVNVLPPGSSSSAGLTSGNEILPCMDTNNPTQQGNTCVKYQIQNQSSVQVLIYKRNGKLIRNLLSENQSAGVYTLLWDGKNDSNEEVGSGKYHLVVSVGGSKLTANLVLIR